MYFSDLRWADSYNYQHHNNSLYEQISSKIEQENAWTTEILSWLKSKEEQEKGDYYQTLVQKIKENSTF